MGRKRKTQEELKQVVSVGIKGKYVEKLREKGNLSQEIDKILQKYFGDNC